jgi:hypothetical protein
MRDGLYGVKFQTPFGMGAGVIVKVGDRVFGGDTGFAWDGNLSVANDTLDGQLNVQRHDTGMPSVFGPLNSFVLTFNGAGNENGATLTATTPSAPGVNMTVKMKLLKAA